MTLGLWIGCALLAVMVIGGAWEALRERKVAKNGCCGQPMTVFDTDSQGGTLVKCEVCGDCDALSWVAAPASWPRRWSGCM